MRVERLANHHDLSSFTCGVKPLDDWLKNHAPENQARDLSRTMVLVNDSDQVQGFFSLAMGGVRKADLPLGQQAWLPRYEIGMVLLARLAIALEHQGEGLGRDLLFAALERAVEANALVAARFIAVDPKDQNAHAFYEHFGFQDVPGDNGGRMYLRMDVAAAGLGSAAG